MYFKYILGYRGLGSAE